MEYLAGKFLVFDGPDGSGKSTQFARFAEACRGAGLDVCEVREPGGTEIGEAIRTVLLDVNNSEMSLRCEMMLYMASRAQLIDELVRPKLDAGTLVLADRFVSSTLAYQGAGGGLPVEEILAVARVAVGTIWPDLTVIIDVDEETRLQRLDGGSRRGRKPSEEGPTLFSDRMERRSSEYFERVRQGYLAQAERQPDRYAVIDGSHDEDTVFEALVDAVERLSGQATGS